MHAIDYSVFEGMSFTGSPVMTILGGEVVCEDGVVSVEAGQGRYVERPLFS